MSYLQQQRVLHSADKRYPSPVSTWWHAARAILYKTIFLPENNLPLLLLDQMVDPKTRIVDQMVDPKTRPIKRSRQAECLWWDEQLLSDQLWRRECLFSDGIVLVSGSIRAADIKRLHWTWTTFGLLSLNLALIWDKPGVKKPILKPYRFSIYVLGFKIFWDCFQTVLVVWDVILISKRWIAAIKDAIAGAITAKWQSDQGQKNSEEVFTLQEVFAFLEWHNQQTTTEILIMWYIAFSLLWWLCFSLSSEVDHQRSGIWGARGQDPEFSSSVMPSRNIFG